jgi:LuxR family maltose regulon positive regulatory protein
VQAGNGKTQPGRAPRRIIDRPRLIRLLDESEARIILLLAPAGYGKTTLARQWAKTLNRSIWITLSPAHRDVAVLAESFAGGIDSLSGDAAGFIREYLGAQSNPQRSHRRLADVITRRFEDVRPQWLVLDDYHELLGSEEAEELVSRLIDGTSARCLIASRHRPTWARPRREVYGELTKIGRELLAMNDAESAELLGPGKSRVALGRQAEGWPAVLALAAASKHPAPPLEAVPRALHSFFAEELFQRAPAALQDRLLDLALLPTLASSKQTSDQRKTIELGTELGFISVDEEPELHPLLREFLLEKLSEALERDERVHGAIDECLRIGLWDGAIDLLKRFRLDDRIESVLTEAFKPLVFSGRLSTLSSLAAVFRTFPSFPPPSIDVIEAETALHDGNYELAAQLSSRVRRSLLSSHPLFSRAAAVGGHSNVQLGRFRAAERAFSDSLQAALDDVDQTEALHGLALTRILGESGEVDTAVSELWRRRHTSPTHLLRAATTEISRRRLDEGLAARLELEEPLLACDQAEDPRARTSFLYGAAFALAQQAQYDQASEWLRRAEKDIEEFDLEFARPHALWLAALVKLGLRHFGQAERLLQSLEDLADQREDPHHTLNARSLRARLLLQTGKREEALALTNWTCPDDTYPSWEGEFLATRAIALAATNDLDGALDIADRATSTSRMIEVRGLVAASKSIVAARKNDPRGVDEVLRRAVELGVWDSVLTAVRSCESLADALAADTNWRDRLMWLYENSNDRGLARRAGFRTRSSSSPDEILTPREMEVLNLIARGMRNAEIARALFISASTTKVHIRHIFEKLGVRTRAEAVLRLQMFGS